MQPCLLIIEDSVAVSAPWRNQLSEAGYRLETVQLASETDWRRQARDNRCTLIILNVSEPDCDLAAAVDAIREEAAEIPIVLLTNAENEDLALAKLNRGANDCISSSQIQKLLPAVKREHRNAAIREELRQNRQALRQSEKRYRRLVEMAPDAILVIIKDKIAFVNSACAAIYGSMHPRRLIGRSAYDFVHPDERELLKAKLDTALARRKRVKATLIRVFKANGEILHTEAVAAPVTYDNQPGLHVILRDVTERKLAQAKLADLNRKLEQRARQLQILAARLVQAEEKERRRIAAILHDDLQQLLVGAKFRLGALPVRLQNSKSSKGLDKVSLLLDKCIEVSRSLTHDLSPPILEDAGLGAGLRWLARVMQEKHNFLVDLHEEMDAENIDNDIAAFIYQAVREFLNNVLKHSGTKAATVSLSALDEAHIQVIVEDKGLGFDYQEIECQHCLGILTIKERLELMGGYLEAVSVPGSGTRIKLVAPAQLQPKVKPAVCIADDNSLEAWQPADPVTDENTPKIRIMLVDDHEVMRHGLALLLGEEADFEIVAEVSDGLAAVEQALKLGPDVILMDVNMPKMNGLEATRLICRSGCKSRIIGLSMHDSADMRAKMLRAGASEYVEKGGQPDKLLLTIRNLLLQNIVGKNC